MRALRLRAFEWKPGLSLKPVSIQTHATQRNARTQRNTHEKRKKRKRLQWQLWLAPSSSQVTQPSMVVTASIEHSYWLALAFVAWKIESVLSLRFLTQWPIASVARLALVYFLFFFDCVIFLRLLRFLRTFYFACVYFLRKTLHALRAFEWKPGFSLSHASACKTWRLQVMCQRWYG